MSQYNSAHSSERVAIFIDGWNFAKATYDGLGVRVDFKRLLGALTGGRSLIRALYYIGEWTDRRLCALTELATRLALSTAAPCIHRRIPPRPSGSEHSSKVSSVCLTATGTKSSRSP